MTRGNDPINVDDFNAGLTKREYFAAQAMQGILCGMAPWLGKGDAISINSAGLAVECADALIEALNEPGAS